MALVTTEKMFEDAYKGGYAVGAFNVINMEIIQSIVEADLSIDLHLDHNPDFETCKTCIDGGFTSVMIDGSHLPYEENVPGCAGKA